MNVHDLQTHKSFGVTTRLLFPTPLQISNTNNNHFSYLKVFSIMHYSLLSSQTPWWLSAPSAPFSYQFCKTSIWPVSPVGTHSDLSPPCHKTRIIYFTSVTLFLKWQNFPGVNWGQEDADEAEFQLGLLVLRSTAFPAVPQAYKCVLAQPAVHPQTPNTLLPLS